MENNIERILLEIGAIKKNSIRKFAENTRDNVSLSVFKCEESGVIFLKGSHHLSKEYYEEKSGTEYWNAKDRKSAIINTKKDDERRGEMVLSMAKPTDRVLDIGTGLGGFIEYLKPYLKNVEGVEIQREIQQHLVNDLGWIVHSSLNEIQEKKYDLITLFHVLEHLTDPLKYLTIIKSMITKGGRLIIEVPHANDFLLKTLELKSFKKFTLWSEHLILHTRDSLSKMLIAAGYTNFVIKGIQRYGLANHLYWLKNDTPGGHQKWNFLDDLNLNGAYSSILAEIDQTDTLLAVAEI